MGHAGFKDRAGYRLDDGAGHGRRRPAAGIGLGGAGRRARLYEAGHFAEAIPYSIRCWSGIHSDIEILNLRGICYLRTEQPEKALADFDRINRRQRSGITSRSVGPSISGSPRAYGNRGIALLMLGRDQDASRASSDRCALEPPWNVPLVYPAPATANMIRGRAGAYEGLGQAYHRLGQDAAAIEAYNQAIAIDPTDPNAFAGRGDVLAGATAVRSGDRRLHRGDPARCDALAGLRQPGDRAATAWAATRRRWPTWTGPSRSTRSSPRRTATGAPRMRVGGRTSLALADYDALIKLMPENAGAYKDRGGVLVRLGRFDGAIKDLDEAIRLDPKRATAYQNRGVGLHRPGPLRAGDRRSDRGDPARPGECGGLLQPRARPFRDRRVRPARSSTSAWRSSWSRETAITHFNRAEAFVRLGMRDRALEDYTKPSSSTRGSPRLMRRSGGSSRSSAIATRRSAISTWH